MKTTDWTTLAELGEVRHVVSNFLFVRVLSLSTTKSSTEPHINPTRSLNMGPKKGENSKKAAGNAKKAEAAAQKAAVEDAKKAAAEDTKWQKGAKDNSKA